MKYLKQLMLFALFFVSHLCFTQTVEKQTELRQGIDWMWGQQGAPTRASTYLRSVPLGGGYRWVRGPLSAQSCLIYATIFALAGENENSLEWLQAGQDHAPSVQADYALYLPFCIDYIKGTYKNEALKNLGISQVSGLPVGYINTALGEIAKHHPAKENAPKEQAAKVPKEHEEHGNAKHN